MLLLDVNPCSAGGDLHDLFSLVGTVITIFKIVIPILLIIWGMLDVGKSVVNAKPEEITKNLKSFAYRAVAAILVFFIPAIVGVILNAVGPAESVDSAYRSCVNLIFYGK